MFNIVLWLYIASQKKKRLPESRVSTDCLSYSKSFFLILAHHLVLISDSDRPNQLSPSLLSLSVASLSLSLSLSLHACMCLFCTTILHISKSSSYISYLCVCVCVCGGIHFVEQSISLTHSYRRFSWVCLFVEKGKLVNILLLFPHSFVTQCTTGMLWGS